MKKQKNKFHIYLLILITVVGTFLRIISLRSNSTPDLTLDDSSRDIITAMHIAKFKEPPFGPPFCGGCPKHFQNSTNYYYFLSFFYRLNSSAAGIYLLFLISGISLIPLTYLIAKSLFNIPIALIAGSLVAVSPKLIYYSNFPLQPFLMPTASCFITLFIILDYFKKSKLFISMAGIILFLTLQIHLSILILIPFYIYSLINRRNIKDLCLILLSVLPFFLWFLKNSFSLEAYSPFSTNHNININPIDVILQSYQNLVTSFSWFIDSKYVIFVPITIILIIIKFKEQIKPVLPLLLSIPIIGLFKNSSTNYYDSPVIPMFIILFSAILFLLYQFREMFFGFIFFSICYININIQINNFNNRQKGQIVIPTIRQVVKSVKDNSKPAYVWEYSDSQDINILYQYYCSEEQETKKPLIPTNSFIDINAFTNDSSKNKFLVCSSEKFPYSKNNENCQTFIKNTLKKNSLFLYGEETKYPNYSIYEIF